MQILWVLGLLILLGSLTIGLTLLVTGHGLGPTDSPAAGRVGTLVDDGLQRTRTAVDVLIQPEMHVDEVRPRSTPLHRSETYVVLGFGLLGVGAVALLGLVLLGLG